MTTECVPKLTIALVRQQRNSVRPRVNSDLIYLQSLSVYHLPL